MKCRQARAKIPTYMDHELDAASSRQLELHLNQCAECREALHDFQELDDMVRVLPRIEPGPDFARQLVMMVSQKAATDEGEHQVKLSLFKRLSRFVEDFVDMVSLAQAPSTGTLDEFGDFPPLSMGSLYFKLISVNR
jgi:anti-sigma factor RsiW